MLLYSEFTSYSTFKSELALEDFVIEISRPCLEISFRLDDFKSQIEISRPCLHFVLTTGRNRQEPH